MRVEALGGYMANKKSELTPRQSLFIQAYTAPESMTFGNAYKSARGAGYTEQTARNITHLQPDWLSENIGQITSVIAPEEIMQKLTRIIGDKNEPTIVKLKAIEMTMKAYSMLVQRRDNKVNTVSLNVDLTSS